MEDRLTRYKKPCIHFVKSMSQKHAKNLETRDFDAIIQDDFCILIVQWIIKMYLVFIGLVPRTVLNFLNIAKGQPYASKLRQW